jgi:hypothetical protein
MADPIREAPRKVVAPRSRGRRSRSEREQMEQEAKERNRHL